VAKKMRPPKEKLEYHKYLDESKFGFIMPKPKGTGAYDLINYTVGEDNHKPSHEDVAMMNNTDFDLLQQHFQNVLDHFKQLLGVPTKPGLKSLLENAKSPAHRQAIQCDYDQRMKSAIAEAHLYNIEHVKYLAWEPDVTVKGLPKYNPDKTLKGRYIIQYENVNKKMVTCAVLNEWAEHDLGVTWLAHAQQFAYDLAKDQEYLDKDGQVVSLSKFVNVADKGVKVQIDNFEINGI